MKLTPLGDRAILATMPSEQAAIQWTDAIRLLQPAWLDDVVPAYASVGVFYDNHQILHREVIEWLKRVKVVTKASEKSGRSIKIPVCYERGLDLKIVAEHLKQTPDDVIALHTKHEYTVYAIGFVPGFPYLGYLPKELTGVPRMASPRVKVEAGSVGLTGRQTGIYPLAKPGGWHVIGQTPLTIVDVNDHFFPIRVGDRIAFERIDETEFTKRDGERLLAK